MGCSSGGIFVDRFRAGVVYCLRFARCAFALRAPRAFSFFHFRCLFAGRGWSRLCDIFEIGVQRLALILLITLDHSFPVWLKNWFIKK